MIAQKIPTNIPTNTSKNQCTPAAILDTFIKITKGKYIQNIFLYPNKYKLVKKAKLTAAWSDGKLASGKWSINGWTKVSGLASSTKCWITKFVSMEATIEKKIKIRSFFFSSLCLTAQYTQALSKKTGAKKIGASAIIATILFKW